MRAAFLACCVMALTACSNVTDAVDNTARKGAKGVVTEVLATRFPQVPKELITPFTDCIIDNSTANEIQEYVKASLRGVDEGTVQDVKNVLARPGTRNCLQGKLADGLI